MSAKWTPTSSSTPLRVLAVAPDRDQHAVPAPEGVLQHELGIADDAGVDQRLAEAVHRSRR